MRQTTIAPGPQGQAQPLRVLHVNTSDVDGGAARAARRLHLALRDIGVDSRMLVLDHHEGGPGVSPLFTGARLGLHRVVQALTTYLTQTQVTPGNPVVHSLNLLPTGAGRRIARSGVDIVHLHWIGGGEMLSVGEIGRLPQPVCWTLHDMWPLCGAEHYDDLLHPGRFREPYAPGNRPAGARGPDLDAWTWRRKRRAWDARRLHLVCPSAWMARCAAESALLGPAPREVIPNCLETGRFRPHDRREARESLGLDPDVRWILFGAASGLRDPRKGFAQLVDAIRSHEAQLRACGAGLLSFGGTGGPAPLQGLSLPARHLGSIRDDDVLSKAYAAADVFACPSQQDNLPNTIAEALACGTPCVGFRSGGVPEMVDDGVTGLLVPTGSVRELGAALVAALSAGLDRDRCRAAALERYGMQQVAHAHLALYQRLLAGGAKR